MREKFRAGHRRLEIERVGDNIGEKEIKGNEE